VTADTRLFDDSIGPVTAADLVRSAHVYEGVRDHVANVVADENGSALADSYVDAYYTRETGIAVVQAVLVKPGVDYFQDIGYFGPKGLVLFEERVQQALTNRDGTLEDVRKATESLLVVKASTGDITGGSSSLAIRDQIHPLSEVTQAVRGDIVNKLEIDGDLIAALANEWMNEGGRSENFPTVYRGLSAFAIDSATTAYPFMELSSDVHNSYKSGEEAGYRFVRAGWWIHGMISEQADSPITRFSTKISTVYGARVNANL